MTKKIRLSKPHREVIQEFGVKHIVSTIDRKKEAEQLAIVLGAANTAIRAKYPEAAGMAGDRTPPELFLDGIS
jgi:hypothetical protein